MNDAQLMDVLEHWNFWNQDRYTGVYRKAYADELHRQRNLKEASVVTGVRRSGKSTMLLQVLQKLIDSGTRRQNILYVNFEEPAFMSSLSVAFLLEWRKILADSLENIIDQMVSPDERGRYLRQSSPFCGILTPRERWEIYESFEAGTYYQGRREHRG